MSSKDEASSIVLSILADLKARDIAYLDVQEQSDFTDFMVIATGTSSRHVSAIVENVTFRLKQANQRILGVEGDSRNNWVLIDLGDLVVHVMQAEARQFYALDQLWASDDADYGIRANP